MLRMWCYMGSRCVDQTSAIDWIDLVSKILPWCQQLLLLVAFVVALNSSDRIPPLLLAVDDFLPFAPCCLFCCSTPIDVLLLLLLPLLSVLRTQENNENVFVVLDLAPPSAKRIRDLDVSRRSCFDI